MSDRPILFSAPMVRAIMKEIAEPGTGKTQTRRIAKWQKIEPGLNLQFSGLEATKLRTHGTPDGVWTLDSRGQGGQWTERARLKTYWPGDRLWVRETWQFWPPNNRIEESMRPRLYAATDEPPKGPFPSWSNWADGKFRWVPPIHMPRWASRITLNVTDVRVQRLSDISDADAMAEGVTKVRDGCYVIPGVDYDLVGLGHTSPVTPFAKLWDGLNGDKPGRAWADNPWVVAVTFKPELRNIDAPKSFDQSPTDPHHGGKIWA